MFATENSSQMYNEKQLFVLHRDVWRPNQSTPSLTRTRNWVVSLQFIYLCCYMLKSEAAYTFGKPARNQWHFLKHSEYTSSTMDSYNTELQVTRLYEPIRMLFRCQGWIPKTQLECNWNAVTFTHLMPPVISLMRTVDEMNPRLTIGSLAVARCLDSCSKTFA